MDMDYATVLQYVIDRGIEAAKQSYVKDPFKLEGSIEGFNSCRGLTPTELKNLLYRSREDSSRAYYGESNEYWRTRCRELEVEWVCNCMSVILQQGNMPVIVSPSARATVAVAKIIGISAPD